MRIFAVLDDPCGEREKNVVQWQDTRIICLTDVEFYCARINECSSTRRN
jgi:hypothetical protein